MATRNAQHAAEKRRLILDAAVRVFARQGFHTCRVSDIADEAGVAYGLVYHYFRSKDEVLDTLFLERWNVMLEAIREVDREEMPARDKLYAITSFIVDSYRHDPELMKVIIVEVTRAANSFGRSHLAEISEAFDLIADIVAKAQARGELKDSVTPVFAAMAFYGAIEQVLTGWIFELLPSSPADIDQAKANRRGDDLRRPRRERRAATRRSLLSGQHPQDHWVREMDNEVVKRLMWMGFVAGIESLASIAAIRLSAFAWRRMFQEDPPGVE